MEKVIYFTFILCGILSQGICIVFEENNEKSSALLIRQKRVMGGAPSTLQSAPYIVSVLENGIYHCIATLLTTNVAISSAKCFIHRNTLNMSIKSRSTLRDGELLHEIVRVIFLDPHYNRAHPSVNNLALVRFFQPINFQSSHNRPISIYSGSLTERSLPNFVIGYGRAIYHSRNRNITRAGLRFLTVVMISVQYCQSVYPNIIEAKNICASAALPVENCEDSDSGAPLVRDDHLLGIFVYRDCSHLANPNVFMNLLDHDIRRWIHEHVPSLRLF